MDGTARRLRRARRSRGETLVETVVAFAVLTILLTMVTTVIRGGIALNNRAVAQLEQLNLDCLSVETGEQLTDPVSETLTLTPIAGNGAADAGGAFHFYVDVVRGRILSVFTATSATEVTGG